MMELQIYHYPAPRRDIDLVEVNLILSIHSINSFYQFILSIHSIYSFYQFLLSIHSIYSFNIFYLFILSFLILIYFYYINSVHSAFDILSQMVLIMIDRLNDFCSVSARLFREPVSKSNRPIIMNAVEYVVFPGAVNKELR